MHTSSHGVNVVQLDFRRARVLHIWIKFIAFFLRSRVLSLVWFQNNSLLLFYTMSKMNILMTLSFKYKYIRTTFSLEYLHIMPIRSVFPPGHEHKALLRPSFSFRGRGSKPNSSAELRMSSGLMGLCVRTNKYSKLHKCPGIEHVESFSKNFKWRPKGLKN